MGIFGWMRRKLVARRNKKIRAKRAAMMKSASTVVYWKCPLCGQGLMTGVRQEFCPICGEKMRVHRAVKPFGYC